MRAAKGMLLGSYARIAVLLLSAHYDYDDHDEHNDDYIDHNDLDEHNERYHDNDEHHFDRYDDHNFDDAEEHVLQRSIGCQEGVRLCRDLRGWLPRQRMLLGARLVWWGSVVL
eukprot:TRINITY_DN6793_c0_g3_i1.p5 TRINITY_DN6793_c0_g3~~TRINITY_DN6793_c0_g3_i1.p5  ORF type:complete len:113 (+),score=24.65 TRINITY_DN6793_c0_g3_i1:203-541(+)